eukprot:scaffold113651_cov60-Phaeocystis_antarctica.AAC.3
MHLATLRSPQRLGVLLRGPRQPLRDCVRQARGPSEPSRVLTILLNLPPHGRHYVDDKHCRDRKTPDGQGAEWNGSGICGATGREHTRSEPSRRSGSGPHRPTRCRPSCVLAQVRQACEAAELLRQRGENLVTKPDVSSDNNTTRRCASCPHTVGRRRGDSSKMY